MSFIKLISAIAGTTAVVGTVGLLTVTGFFQHATYEIGYRAADERAAAERKAREYEADKINPARYTESELTAIGKSPTMWTSDDIAKMETIYLDRKQKHAVRVNQRNEAYSEYCRVNNITGITSLMREGLPDSFITNSSIFDYNIKCTDYKKYIPIDYKQERWDYEKGS
jgi:hypothetical protein